jgi:hypothetical protein
MGMEIIDAEASISDSSFSGNLHLSLLVSSGAVVQLVDVEIVDTLLGHQARGGASLGLQDAAVVEASRLSVHDSAGPGAFVTAGSSLSCSDCTFRDTDFAGLVVLDGELPLQDGSVSASRPGPSIGGGVGILCWHPPELGTGPVLRVEGTHLDGHAGPAVYLRGRGSYSLSGVHITGSAMLPGVPGAVLAMEGVEPWNEATGAGLHLEDVGFSGLPGDAILLDASSGTFEGLVFDDVAGYELRLQHCDGVEPPIDSGLLESNDCAGPLLLLDPPLWFAPAVEVIDVVE